MKHNFTLLFFLFLLNLSIFSQNNADLYQYKVVPLYSKNNDDVKVLQGIANIRFKENTFSKTNNNVNKTNNDFKIIDSYISELNKISNQKKRFNEYIMSQQKIILELEKILSRTFIVEFSPDIDVLKFCYNIKKKYPEIEIAEPYYIDHFMYKPNDLDVDKQSVLRIIKAFDA